MPRRSRLHLDGVPLHILQRGLEGQPCFFGEDDYRFYLDCLDRSLADSGCRLQAYVLMPNHVHLLLTPQRADQVPRLLISLNRRYVQQINRSQGRSGSLWDPRYRSSAVHAPSHLLLSQRYIELNPVRAGLVDKPAQYRWSSYGANAQGLPEPRIEPHAVYRKLGDTPRERRAAYKALFRPPPDAQALDAIRLALNQNQPLGNERFLSRIENLTGVRREARPRGRPRLQPADAPAPTAKKKAPARRPASRKARARTAARRSPS